MFEYPRSWFHVLTLALLLPASGIWAQPNQAEPDAAKIIQNAVKNGLREVNPPNIFPAARIQPARRVIPEGLPFDLTNLALAKYTEGLDGPELIAMIERTRNRAATVQQVRMVQEKRTRTIRRVGADGVPVDIEQEYTVAVPVMHEIEAEQPVPAGRKPTSIPFSKLKFYRLDGTKLTEKESIAALEKMSPVFLLRGFVGEVKPLEEVYQLALNPKCLIAVESPH